MMPNVEFVLPWLAKANGDLLAAQRLFEDYHPKQLDISCYHCQQAIEKALKGYLLFAGCEPPHTHNLGLLCQLCSDYDQEFEQFYQKCNNISPYATQTRYPNNHEHTEEETHAALQAAQCIVDHCTKKISP
ncbi:MAG: HEPN domain-containing protein [Oscillospiraceae bacterium]|nr:HEPN domain-containing protein [Oscillospiraceae bacterium]